MKKYAAILILYLTSTLTVQAQYYPGYGKNKDSTNAAQQIKTPSHKFFAGGGAGLSFGYYTYLDISPEVGYRLSSWLAGGISLNFNFISDKSVPGVTQNQTILGGGVFARVYPLSHIFLQVQPEYNSSSSRLKDGSGGIYGSAQYGVMSLLMGGGYVERIGGGSEFTFGIMYDVLQNPGSPYYGIPVIQGGVDIGF
ncbi:MAG TPA: hypothetical protein VNE41_11890 [Chitinophagaceae bacterium]|nr:hypothetical protein [Chitinophagaceae bacterium]